MTDALMIRTMTRAEIDIAVDWAAAEGWNPGLHDADAFYAADPEGFFLGLINDKPVGCISSVMYPDAFGFIGFYIVAPEHRGKGYGIQLWNYAMDRLKSVNTGLDGVVEQQPNYKKSGFKLAYSNIRFEGRNLEIQAETLREVRELSDQDFPSVFRYDRRCFPSVRDDFLRQWLTLPDSLSLVSINHDVMNGYGTIRACRSGYKIGPLFADNWVVATSLLKKLCDRVEPDTPVYLDVPEVNASGMRIAQTLGMTKVFGTARMYTGEAPGIDLDKVFGVTSFELG